MIAFLTHRKNHSLEDIGQKSRAWVGPKLPVTPSTTPTPALTGGCPLRKSPSLQGTEALRSLCLTARTFSHVGGEVSSNVLIVVPCYRWEN